MVQPSNIEPIAYETTQKEIEGNQSRNIELTKPIQDFFNKPIEQSGDEVPSKKVEKIVITTEETDAIFNNH